MQTQDNMTQGWICLWYMMYVVFYMCWRTVCRVAQPGVCMSCMPREASWVVARVDRSCSSSYNKSRSVSSSCGIWSAVVQLTLDKMFSPRI